MTTKPNDPCLTEESAALVLERASQLDAARGRDVSVNELRLAALEAGISAEAFEKALGEIASAWTTVSGSSGKPAAAIRPWAYRARVLSAGLALGVLTLILDSWIGDAGILYALVLALFTAIGLVLKRRGARSVIAFEATS